MSMTTRWRFPAALLLTGALLLSAAAAGHAPAPGAGVAPATPPPLRRPRAGR